MFAFSLVVAVQDFFLIGNKFTNSDLGSCKGSLRDIYLGNIILINLVYEDVLTIDFT